MVLLYSTTIFLSAFLIFLVQPIIGKLLLPMAGGSPSVWNACMLFFQALMLAGYSYTHFSQKKLGIKKQSLAQLVFMLATLLFLPIRFTSSTGIPDDPTFWLLINLFRSAGIPFFILATLSPMLQLWFAHTGHSRAANPFFLYAASNIGSFTALLAYPFLIEPFIDLSLQTTVWAGGYAVLIVLIFFCRRAIKADTLPEIADVIVTIENIEQSTIIKWVVAAFISSSLLMGSTLFITTDLAPVPLLWILPLMIFLITFVIAFSQHSPPFWLVEMFAIAAVFVFAVTYSFTSGHQLWLTIPLHLLVLFAICLYCHSYLANSKPHVRHLTAFYAWISLGGMLGGLFNTLIAPYVFVSYTEYPLMIAASSLFIYLNRKKETGGNSEAASARLVSLVTGFLVAASIIAVKSTNFSQILHRLAARSYIETESGYVSVILAWLETYQDLFTVLLAIVIALTPMLFIPRIRRFNLTIVAIVMMLCFSAYKTGTSAEIIYITRNFFGKKTVSTRHSPSVRVLHNGSTYHGAQDLAPEHRNVPLSYYHNKGPVGDIFALPIAQKTDLKVGIIGLGVGSTATYSKPGNEFTFYEIDPDVIDMVGGESPIFSFIYDNASQCRIICGDGRLKINEAKDGFFDIIFLDAFSSDAIPVHLITAEALQIYLSKLKPDGIVALHISNRYLNLQPILKKMAEVNSLKSLVTFDGAFDRSAKSNFLRAKCTYVVMTKNYQTIEDLTKVSNKTWEKFSPDEPDLGLWTDSYSSLIPILKMP